MSENSPFYNFMAFGVMLTVLLIIFKISNVIQRGWLLILAPAVVGITVLISYYCCMMFLWGLIISFSLSAMKADQHPKEAKDDDDDDDDDD